MIPPKLKQPYRDIWNELHKYEVCYVHKYDWSGQIAISEAMAIVMRFALAKDKKRKGKR